MSLFSIPPFHKYRTEWLRFFVKFDYLFFICVNHEFFLDNEDDLDFNVSCLLDFKTSKSFCKKIKEVHPQVEQFFPIYFKNR